MAWLDTTVQEIYGEEMLDSLMSSCLTKDYYTGIWQEYFWRLQSSNSFVVPTLYLSLEYLSQNLRVQSQRVNTGQVEQECKCPSNNWNGDTLVVYRTRVYKKRAKLVRTSADEPQ